MRCRSALLAIWLVAGIVLHPCVATEPEPKRVEFSLAIHGGVGVEPDKLSDEQKKHHRQVLGTAIEIGRNILAGGGTALDAVEQTVRFLEDDPLYNAGKGACFNSVGKHELDASIMDGKTGQGGAVACLTTVKNPISLARLVMTETPHVLLMGDGAESFADAMREHKQIERVPNDYFSTEKQREEWQRELLRTKPKPASVYRGTVGCVARDQHGNLAAATSTGGMTNKRWGRVGDSPILGAGTYANNATCAVSCTGTGEYFIRNSIAFRVSALMEYKGLSLEEAVLQAIDKDLPDDIGGLIAVDRDGSVSMRFNTVGMARGAADSTGKLEILLGH